MSKPRIWSENATKLGGLAAENRVPVTGVFTAARRTGHMRYFFRLTDGKDEINPHEGIDLLGNVAKRLLNGDNVETVTQALELALMSEARLDMRRAAEARR